MEVTLAGSRVAPRSSAAGSLQHLQLGRFEVAAGDSVQRPTSCKYGSLCSPAKMCVCLCVCVCVSVRVCACVSIRERVTTNENVALLLLSANFIGLKTGPLKYSLN